jgi:invasion protein IalB/pimeloyl-ACP methyl ester carboxylesterase
LLFSVALFCCDAQRAVQLDLNQTKATAPVANIDLLQLEEKDMPTRLLQVLLLATIGLLACYPASGDESASPPRVEEEMWALPFPLPVLAYVVRPLGDGPFPLVVMNHGISLDANQRTMFPAVEYRDAAFWFARHGYFVISPLRYGASSLDDKDRGLYGAVFAHVGSCDNPNFRGAGLAIATLNEWVIENMQKKKQIAPGKVIVVGQSGGGWGSIALASRNPSSVRAIITFAAGRGGRVDGKPNNNCAPDKLVTATGDFGRTARVPMLWIYAENDSYFGPELTKRMHDAFTAAGGDAEYHLLPAFGNDGHFMIDSPDAVPLWAPLVSQFLEKHSAMAQAPQLPTNSAQNEKLQLRPPRLQLPPNIQYSAWRKLCFKGSDGATLCRTTSAGTLDNGEVVVRVDLIERPAGGAARLQLFVPQGGNLAMGVKATVDQGAPIEIQYNWCLTNICIAADHVSPKLIGEMESGQILKLEQADFNSSTVAMNIPLNQFVAAHKGPPAETYDFNLEEN